MSKLEVKKTLEVDQKYRNLSNTNINSSDKSDLWLLKQINFNKDWDYSLPTIYTKSKVNLRNSMIKDINHFNVLFRKNYGQYFSHVNFSNILIAGGCVSKTLLQSGWENDVDIFLYGLTVEQANAKIEELIGQIYKSYQTNKINEYLAKAREEGKDIKQINQEELNVLLSDEVDIMNVRNKNCLSLNFYGSIKIQIIFRLYKSISEILHGFDLGSSAIGYDGQEIYFTSLGKFAYEYLANIVDTTRRSTTYEVRLIKYFNRGFQIILPYFNMQHLRKDYLKYNLVEVCELPYFVFSYDQVNGNKIDLVKLIDWGSNVKKAAEDKLDSDYQPDDLDEYKVFYLNLKNLVKNQNNYYYFSNRLNFDIINDPPYITSSRIIDFYDSLEKKIFSKEGFNSKLLSAYFSDEYVPQIVNEMFIKKNYKYLKEIIEKQKNIILQRFNQIKNSTNRQINWITKNPGTQLTSSFNPIIANPQDWYGSYYLPDPFNDKEASLPRPIKPKKTKQIA